MVITRVRRPGRMSARARAMRDTRAVTRFASVRRGNRQILVPAAMVGRPMGGRSAALRNIRTAGFLGIENKFLDCAFNSVTINVSTDGSSGEIQPSAGCTGAISVPAQGDGESNRDGRKYVLTSAFISGVINFTPAADQADVTDASGIYMCLVLDTQANGATVVSEDVFINPSTSGFAMLPQPLRNLQNSKRFKILDSWFRTPATTVAGTDGASTNSVIPGQQLPVKLSWKGRITCLCDGTTADVASATDNALHIIGYAGGASFAPVFVGKSRVRFVG